MYKTQCVAILLCFVFNNAYAGLPIWPNQFKFSSGGIPSGYNCIQILEPSSNSWDDNYFCWVDTTDNPGIKWSAKGTIDGMECTQILETSDGSEWNDNYLCVPKDSPYKFSWSFDGILPDTSCLKWLEKSGTSFTDNFLCGPPVPEPSRLPVWPQEYLWSSGGVPDEGYDCIQILEPSWGSWDDNYFCWPWGLKNPGLKWDYNGAGQYAPYMDCLQINEPSNNSAGDDNYLCSPKDFPYELIWSYSGAIQGKDCIQWKESSTKSWNDNYLCAQ